MKLKQIFALLGVALLGLSACSKDTPKTNPASSGSLAGSQWEYIEQELEDDGKTETTTTVLRFIDGTKFVTESTSVTTQGGTILKSETDTPEQGTYTYQGKEVTLTTTHQDDGKTETTTTVLRFIDGTKFVTESTSVTTQGGTILKSETDTPEQGTYTYQGKEVTLTTTRQDDGKIVASIVRLIMDDTNQTLAGTVTEDGVRKGIIYTRKK